MVHYTTTILPRSGAQRLTLRITNDDTNEVVHRDEYDGTWENEEEYLHFFFFFTRYAWHKRIVIFLVGDAVYERKLWGLCPEESEVVFVDPLASALERVSISAT